MKMIVKTGLVPIRLYKAYDKHRASEIAGFIPERARELIRTGAGTQDGVDIPLDIDVVEIPGPIEIVVQEGAKVHGGQARFIPSDRPKTKDEPEVEIPDDWQDMHVLQKIALAKKLGDPKAVKATDDRKAAEVATDIIQAEVDRRAAA